jgi:hypothetical protein
MFNSAASFLITAYLTRTAPNIISITARKLENTQPVASYPATLQQGTKGKNTTLVACNFEEQNNAHLDLHGQLPAPSQQRLRALRLVPVAPVAVGGRQLLRYVARQLLQLVHQAAQLVAHTVVL